MMYRTRQVTPKPRGWAAAALLALAVAVCYSLYAMRPPEPVPADGPATEFSAHRAIQHDFIIASEPHPAGSVANDKVPIYIRDTLKSFAVDANIVSSYFASKHNAGRRDMVLARIPGTANTKAFALMAHYDSVPYGPGAADDCSGVISMLEIARAIKASPPLKNDIIFVFTDGEEGSKLGSRAFLEHPWFNEVGVMTDLESRGTCGNSILFDISDENGWLIENMAQAVRYPTGTSLGYDIYKRMPFSTDFDELRPRGMKGFDIAFVENFAWYHTKNDTPEHLDLGTLQQHGMFGLDLARRFGSIPLDGTLTAPDRIYFNTLGYRLTHYPIAWGGPLAIITAVLVALTLIVGRVRGHVSLMGVIAGVVVWALTAGLAAVVSVSMLAAIWGTDVVRDLYTKDFTRIPNLYPLYHNGLYTTAFAVASVGVAALVYGMVCRWVRAQSLVVGAYLWWTAGLLAMAYYLPGGSYLLMWPLAISAIGMLIYVAFTSPERMSAGGLFTHMLLALPAVAMFVPAYRTFAYTVMIMAAPGLAVFVVVAMGLLIPALDLMGRVNRWWAPALSAAVALGLVLYGLANSSFSPLRPKLDSLAYGIDYDTNKAYWLSADTGPDEWTSQFFPPDVVRAEYDEFANGRGEKAMKSSAPISPDYPGPQITVASDTTADGVRELVLHVASPAKAAQMELRVAPDTEVLAASVFGKPLDGEKKHWRMNFNLFPREGADLTLRIPAGRPVKLNARELFFGVPTLPGFKPRPDYIACMPNTVDHHGRTLEGNRTYVVRTVEL